ETRTDGGVEEPLTEVEIAGADAVVLATEVPVDEARFVGKPIVRTGPEEVIAGASGVLARALPSGAVPSGASATGLHIVGVTSCPTGIAHTFMAAEGLERGAEALGHHVKIETRGSVGARNALTDDDIAAADVVVVAADTNVDLARFAGKRLYQTNTKAAIKDGAAVLRAAIAEARRHGGEAGPARDLVAASSAGKAEKAARAGALYKHLMTGVSHMLPFVVAGGLLMAVAFAIGSVQLGDQGIYIYEERYAGTLAHTLFTIGSKGAFGLFVPVLAGYIAFSIADRPGLAPGMIGGFLAVTTGAGFLGGIAAGFLAGYAVAGLNRVIRLPRTLEGLKPTLILPLLGALVTGLGMVYVVGEPVAAVLNALTAWLTGLGSGSAGALGALLGGMMALDMGGPVNKTAYTFSTGLLGSQVYG
ncbi:MAG: fructose-specific PTS transporter subunit EIIC, partial [Myxococcota bacterium]